MRTSALVFALVFCTAAHAEPTSAVPRSWLSERSRLSNAAVLQACLSREIEKVAGIKPSYMAVSEKSGRLLVGFAGERLGDWPAGRVTGLSSALAVCLLEALPSDVVDRWKDETHRDATFRALVEITDGNAATSKAYVIDHASKRLVPAPDDRSRSR